MEIGTSEWTLKLPEIDTKFLCVCVIFYTKDSRFSLLLKGDYDPPTHRHTKKEPLFQRLDIQKIKLNDKIRKKIEDFHCHRQGI